jgi:NADPH-dependent curcumin reductase CurA
MMLPTHYRRLAVFEPSPDFCQAARVVETELTLPAAREVLIRTRYAGVNASDPMAATGGYGYTSLPFDLGLECGGEILAVGSEVEHLKVGDQGLVFGLGGYTEYRRVPAEQLFAVSEVTPELISAFVAGITAPVGLNETQSLRSGETVLVTAAAGGVGSFAVQLAKLAGNRVIGTCGDDSKAERLKALGCERVINHRKEDLDAVLRQEYPQGINLVFEGVGRRMFDIAFAHLAPFGRLVCIGAVSEYADGANWEKVEGVRIYRALLGKSASIRGCLLTMYPADVWRGHFDRLRTLMADGSLHAAVDNVQFHGIESIAEAVKHLQAGRNWGKVVIRF